MINNAEVAAGENKENALPEICILYDFVLVPTNKRRSKKEREWMRNPFILWMRAPRALNQQQQLQPDE